jgi:hypothetical protein
MMKWLGWQGAEARACGRNRRAGAGGSACRPVTWDRGEYTFPCSGPRNLCYEPDMIHRKPPQ